MKSEQPNSVVGTETQRLDNMLKAAEEQKKIVETLRETQELLKKR